MSAPNEHPRSVLSPSAGRAKRILPFDVTGRCAVYGSVSSEFLDEGIVEDNPKKLVTGSSRTNATKMGPDVTNELMDKEEGSIPSPRKSRNNEELFESIIADLISSKYSPFIHGESQQIVCDGGGANKDSSFRLPSESNSTKNNMALAPRESLCGVASLSQLRGDCSSSSSDRSPVNEEINSACPPESKTEAGHSIAGVTPLNLKNLSHRDSTEDSLLGSTASRAIHATFLPTSEMEDEPLNFILPTPRVSASQQLSLLRKLASSSSFGDMSPTSARRRILLAERVNRRKHPLFKDIFLPTTPLSCCYLTIPEGSSNLTPSADDSEPETAAESTTITKARKNRRRKRKGTPQPPPLAVCAACGESYETAEGTVPAGAVVATQVESSDKADEEKPKAPQQSTKRATHFIAIRVDDVGVLNRISQIQEDILENAPHLEPARVNVTKMHVSLLVVSLRPHEISLAVETVRFATAQFCAARRRHLIRRNALTEEETVEMQNMFSAKNLLSSKEENKTMPTELSEAELLPLDVNLSVVGTFGTQVLFAGMELEEMALLTNLHEMLGICFAKAGILVIGAGSHLNGVFKKKQESEDAPPTDDTAAVPVSPSHRVSAGSVISLPTSMINGTAPNLAAVAATAYYLPAASAPVPCLRLCAGCAEEHKRCMQTNDTPSQEPPTDEEPGRVMAEDVGDRSYRMDTEPEEAAGTEGNKEVTTASILTRLAPNFQTPQLDIDMDPSTIGETGKQRRRRRRRQKLKVLLAEQQTAARLKAMSESKTEEVPEASSKRKNPGKAAELYLLLKYDLTARGVVFHPHVTMFKTSVALRKAKGSESRTLMRQLKLRPADYHEPLVLNAIRTGAITEEEGEKLITLYHSLLREEECREDGDEEKSPVSVEEPADNADNAHIVRADNAGESEGLGAAIDKRSTTDKSPKSPPLLKSNRPWEKPTLAAAGEGLSLSLGIQRVFSVELLEMSRCDADGYYRRLVSVPLCPSPPEDMALRDQLEKLTSSFNTTAAAAEQPEQAK